MQCPIVKIKSENESGFVLINESDFDPKKHVIFDQAEEKKEPKPKKAK